MTSVDAPDQARRAKNLAVWFGGVSVACWCCCPFWALVSFLALPMGVLGFVRAVVEYRASARLGERRSPAVVGGVLSLVGVAAAVAYLVFLGTHPDLPVQG